MNIKEFTTKDDLMELSKIHAKVWKHKQRLTKAEIKFIRDNMSGYNKDYCINILRQALKLAKRSHLSLIKE